MAAYSSVQIIAQLLCLSDEARRLCFNAKERQGLPARVYLDGQEIDKGVVWKTRFVLMQQFGLYRSRGKLAFTIESITFTFSYQAGYGCAILQLLTLSWARESILLAAILTPVALISSIPLVHNLVSNAIIAYHAAKQALNR